jgi:hypothetical protein
MPDHHSQVLLAELDSRQDAVLAELDALNLRLEQALAEHTGEREPCDA